MNDAPSDPLATIGHRIAARLADWMALFVVWIPILAVSTSENAEGVNELSRSGVIVWILIVVCYETLFVAWRGQTPGKMLVGLEIVRHADGSRPGLGSSLLRVAPVAVAMSLLGLFFPIVMVFVYFSAGFMRDSRGVLDRLAGTAVILARASGGMLGSRDK